MLKSVHERCMKTCSDSPGLFDDAHAPARPSNHDDSSNQTLRLRSHSTTMITSSSLFSDGELSANTSALSPMRSPHGGKILAPYG